MVEEAQTQADRRQSHGGSAMLGVWFLEKAQYQTDTEKGELGVKGEKKKRKKNCLIKRCTDGVSD